ncbi:unnamed protein product, partial [marine sediment metagenome]
FTGDNWVMWEYECLLCGNTFRLDEETIIQICEECLHEPKED